MKKIIFLSLVTVASYGQTLQNTTFGNVKIQSNATDNTATKVVVQSSNNVLNTIAKNDLIDVVIVNTTAELTGGIGNISKLYATRDNTIIYRYNGTIYVPLGGDISSKEDIANKQNSLAVDGTNTKYPTVTAVNTGLALKANLVSPTFTGAPLAPTATAGTNTTQIATTAFVNGAIGNGVALSANSVTIGSSSTNTDFPIPFVSSGSSFQNIYNNAPISINPSTNLLKLGGPMQITGSVSATNFNGSATLTGTPTAPTATAGANTTQIATTAFVTGADAGNVKLTGNQTILGTKTFNTSTSSESILSSNTSSGRGILSNNSSTGQGFYSNNSSTGTGFLSSNTSSGRGILSNNSSTGQGFYSNNSSTGNGVVSNSTTAGTGFNYVGQNQDINTFTVNKLGATTATSFINSTAPATNALLANGTTLAVAPITGGTGYIQNQNASAQSANMWISGSIKAANFSTINGGGTMTIDNIANYGSSLKLNSAGSLPMFLQTNGVTALTLASNSSATFASSVSATDGLFSGDIQGDGNPTLKTFWGGAYSGALQIKTDGSTVDRYVRVGMVSGTKTWLGGMTVDTNLNATFSSSVTATNFNGSATLTGVPTAPTAAAGTNTTQIATTAFVQSNSRPYKVYTALLSQSGTDDPTAIVLENTLGGTVLWARSNVGRYNAILTGAFTENKTVTFVNQGVSSPLVDLRLNRQSSDVCILRTYDADTFVLRDDSMFNALSTVEIRVYN